MDLKVKIQTKRDEVERLFDYYNLPSALKYEIVGRVMLIFESSTNFEPEERCEHWKIVRPGKWQCDRNLPEDCELNCKTKQKMNDSEQCGTLIQKYNELKEELQKAEPEQKDFCDHNWKECEDEDCNAQMRCTKCKEIKLGDK